MQTKTFAILFCLSTLCGATAWSMQPGARLVAAAARQRLALSVPGRTCTTPSLFGMRQLPGKGLRRFQSTQEGKRSWSPSWARLAQVAIGAGAIGTSFVAYDARNREQKNERDAQVDLKLGRIESNHQWNEKFLKALWKDLVERNLPNDEVQAIKKKAQKSYNHRVYQDNMGQDVPLDEARKFHAILREREVARELYTALKKKQTS